MIRLNRNLDDCVGDESAGEAELCDLTDEAVGLALWRSATEVIGAEILVKRSVSTTLIRAGLAIRLGCSG